jgi:hypothetical protein
MKRLRHCELFPGDSQYIKWNTDNMHWEVKYRSGGSTNANYIVLAGNGNKPRALAHEGGHLLRSHAPFQGSGDRDARDAPDRHASNTG